MLQRLIDDIKEEVKSKDCKHCLLVVQAEAFEQLKTSDFNAKIVSLNDWELNAPFLSKGYDNRDIHVILQKTIFQKASVEDDGYFLYKNNLWKAMPHLDGCVGFNEEYGCCTFDEGHNEEDWIKSDELIPIKNEDIAKLIMSNLDILVYKK